jgi:hypothetical protein
MFNLVVARVQTLTTGSWQQNNCSHNSRFNSINAQLGESLSSPRSGGLSQESLTLRRIPFGRGSRFWRRRGAHYGTMSPVMREIEMLAKRDSRGHFLVFRNRELEAELHPLASE